MATLGKVRRTKDGSWIADVSINGRRKVGRAATKKEAEARRRELVAELLEGGPQVSVGPPGASFTMQDAYRLSASLRWNDTAGARTALINARAAVEFLGPHTQLADVTARDVDRWRAELLRLGNRSSTVNRKTSALRAMMTDASLRGHLAAAPRLPKQLRENASKDRVIEDHERDLICQWFIQAGQPAAASMFQFLLETAARFGEAQRLRGQDVDLKKGTVTFWETKNGKARTIPLTRRAIDSLTPHMPAIRSHRVFPYSYLQMRRLLERAKDGCGLGDEPITIHTCRHTCASRLARAGIPLHQLMIFGGWSSTAACARYLHLTTDSLASCVAALEG